MFKAFKKTLKAEIPKEILSVVEGLKNAGFEAFLVGGCTRDLILGRKPKDWDVTTNAKPEEIIKVFPKTFYENAYGTVGVVNEAATDESVKVVEVTPYRLEAEYSDFRRPDSVTFSNKLEDDLQRRDFTINAIALSIENDGSETIIDPYGGREDLDNRIIRTVGEASDRFREDALRMLRAVRLSAELGFAINDATANGIKDNASLIEKIAKERIKDEFTRIVMSDRPMLGLELSQRQGLLKYVVPELEAGIGVEQKGVHTYDVWEHLLRSVQHAADKKWPLEVRLAALFHDISKPETRRVSRETKEYTFYGHEVVGSRVTRKILERLRFPTKVIEKVELLVRWHMFFTDTEQITLSAVRRMVANVGKENIWDLMDVRVCDRIGTGRPKETPYRLRKYKSMIEEALTAPISVGMLKINGSRIMEVTHVTPGPKIGFILHALLEEVLENPELNTEEYLENRAKELINLSEAELKELGEEGRKKKDIAEEEKLRGIRKKYKV